MSTNLPRVSWHRIGLPVFAAALFAAAPAPADTIDLRFAGIGQGRSMRITEGANWASVFAGQIRFDGSNGTGLLSDDSAVVSFCTEVAQGVSGTPQSYILAPLASVPGSGPMGADRAAAVQSVFNRATDLSISPFSPMTDPDLAAGFQVAIWEVVNDYTAGTPGSGLSLTEGVFRAGATDGSAISPAIRSWYEQLTDSLGAAQGDRVRVGALTNGQYQDQLTIIPEPAAATLACLGLLMARRARRAPAAEPL